MDIPCTSSRDEDEFPWLPHCEKSLGCHKIWSARTNRLGEVAGCCQAESVSIAVEATLAYRGSPAKNPSARSSQRAAHEVVSTGCCRHVPSYITNPNIRGSHIVSGGQYVTAARITISMASSGTNGLMI